MRMVSIPFAGCILDGNARARFKADAAICDLLPDQGFSRLRSRWSAKSPSGWVSFMRTGR